MTFCALFAVVPKVELTPKTVTVMEGGNVKAVCSASGSPVPVILWSLDMLSTHYEVRYLTFNPLLNVAISYAKMAINKVKCDGGLVPSSRGHQEARYILKS